MELRQLLIDFATAYAEGRTLAPAEMTQLENCVRAILFEELGQRTAREEIPIGVNPVVWRRSAHAMRTLAPELVRDIENKFNSDEVFDATIRQLNRLLRRGARGAPPRLVKQVLIRLNRGETEFDPRALIADAYKYSVSDAISAERRRNPRSERRRKKRPRPKGLPDRLVLLRSEAALAEAADHCPRELAFCIVRDYSRGGVPRAKCKPFERLRIGSTTIAEVLGRVDAEMDAFSAANQGTRRKDPRLAGIGDTRLARILSDIGERVSANSIPALAKRHRSRCEDALRKGNAP